MADIAVAFHWGPRDLGEMTPADLARWRDRARERLEPKR